MPALKTCANPGGDDQPDITEIARRIDKQLHNSFYQDAKITVRLSQYGKPAKGAEKPKPVEQRISIPDAPQPPELLNKVIVSNSDDPNDYEIALDIAIDENGKVSVKHGVSTDYLSEYVDKWKQESERRGLEIDIEALRQEVLNDFVSLETEQSFFKKFIQETKGLLTDAVAGYVEGVQATQKVAKHVWREGKINESVWYTKDPEHEEWPEYMHPAPVVGGVADGVIDEIVGIPLAIRSVYEIATDEQKREGFKAMFGKEGFDKLKDELKAEVKEVLKEEDKQEHFVGQTTVAVTAMFTGFSIFTGGKLSELLDKVTGFLKKLSAKAAKAFEDIRNFFKHKPEDRKKLDEHFKKYDDIQKNDLGEQLAEEVDEMERLKVQPQKFIDGKDYDIGITRLIDEGNPEYCNYSAG